MVFNKGVKLKATGRWRMNGQNSVGHTKHILGCRGHYNRQLVSSGMWRCVIGIWHFDGMYRVTQKKQEILKNPTKIEEIQEKKFIDRNWTNTTCLLRDSNPNYQCLKITSFRWRPPPHMHSFNATTHFKSSRSFVSPCVCCMLCRMRRSRILQSMKECIRGGGRHLQDVIFKHW